MTIKTIHSFTLAKGSSPDQSIASVTASADAMNRSWRNMVDNTTSSIDKVFAYRKSCSARPHVVNSNPVNFNEVPAVPLNSCQAVNGKEEHWLPSYIEDILYIQMCETEIKDPQNGGKISRYYFEAAKYAGRISAGNFDGKNAKYKPLFEIHYGDFTRRLQNELLLLMKQSPSTLNRVVQDAVFRIFKARHKLIFYQYIESEGLSWRFIGDWQ